MYLMNHITDLSGRRVSKTFFLCERWPYSGGESFMGADDPDSYVKDVLKGGNPKKSWQDQSNGVHPRVYLG